MTGIQTDAKSTGAKIRNMRKTRCLTLQQIADNIGVSVSAVSQYERGIIKPDAIMLFKIARALECPLTDIASKSEIEKMRKELHEFLNILPQEMRSIYASAIDAEPVRHGRWHHGECSACKGICIHYKPPYCPNYGAKMDGDENAADR